MNTPTATNSDRLYSARFLLVFCSAALFMTSVSLQFHFGQYIAHLGYDVDTLGWILGVSMVGTLATRLHIGRWIDRFGCKPVWLIGTVTVAVAVGSMQFADQVWLITLLRTISTVATAAAMTTVAVFAALMASPGRRAESLGTIGLAGFLGMILGPTLGDWIFSDTGESMMPYRVFFLTSAVFSLLAGAIMLALRMPPGRSADETGRGRRSVSESRTATRRNESQISVIIKHWPGAILLIGVVFSLAFCLQMLFLERLAEIRGFKNIKVFFLVYAPTAMVLRVIFRRLPARLGRTRTLLGGLVLLVAGELSLLGVASESDLVIPALLMGAGHCFIFPSMIDLGAERLPVAHRGTGTSLVLGAGDVGQLIGFVGLGQVIHVYGFDRALVSLACAVTVGGAVFAYFRREDWLPRRA